MLIVIVKDLQVSAIRVVQIRLFYVYLLCKHSLKMMCLTKRCKSTLFVCDHVKKRKESDILFYIAHS